METGFLLRWMNIDVERMRIHLQHQKCHRMLPLHEDRVIALPQSIRDRWTLNRTAIQKTQLHLTRRTTHARPTDVTRHRDAPMSERLDHQQLIRQIPDQSPDPLQPIPSGGQMKHRLAVAHECERRFRMRDRMQTELLLHMRVLRRLGTEKLPPSGHIEKDRPHLNACPRRTTAFSHRLHPSSMDLDLGAGQRIRLPRRQLETRHRSNARKRFTAKPKGMDGRKIFLGSDLACRMSLDAHQRVFTSHATSIIHHSNQCRPAPLDVHFHMGCPRVQAVLHQLSNHRSRALHNLASSHLTGERIGKNSNF